MSSTNATSILQPSISIAMEALTAICAELKYGHHKSLTICFSTSSLVSVIASLLLIKMIFSSKNRLSTTYHRLMLGLSISDLLFSMPNAKYGVTSPSEMSYLVWNASGNQATCSIEGFINNVRLTLTLFYSCSLNLYYLATVNYNKPDTYVCTKIAPFLHWVPILIGLMFGVISLINKNNNNAGGLSCSATYTYNTPHCIGYENGQVREGFKIPCERGRHPGVIHAYEGILICMTPVIMIVSMTMIYRGVSNQEKKMSQYGASTLNQTVQHSSTPNPNRNNSCSRAVLHKALAYTITYFLTWGWGIAIGMMSLVDKGEPIALSYIWVIFQSLQGFYNLFIFMQLKVMAAKISKGADLSWGKAFATAFWSSLGFGKSKNNENTQPAGVKKTDPVTIATAGSSSRNQRRHDQHRSSNTAEEEKTEIKAHNDGDDLESS